MGIAYPESLLAREIWMPRITPESSSYETSVGIVFRPRKASTRPVITRVILRDTFISFFFCQNIMFIRMESILLVVCCKLKKWNNQSKGCKEIIGSWKRCVRLKDSHIGRQTKEEEENILNGCDKCKVCNLEQPSRDSFAKNIPPVVFLLSEKVICIIKRYEISNNSQIEETTTVGIVTQPKHIVLNIIVRQRIQQGSEKALASTSR